MSDGELAVLAIFRSYRVTANQMLFLNGEVDARLRSSMTRLIDKGWIIRDKRKHSYYLTGEGYDAMRSLSRGAVKQDKSVCRAS